MKTCSYNYKKNNANRTFIEILFIGLLGSMMLIPPNTSLLLSNYFQENPQIIPIMLGITSGNSDLGNNKSYLIMKQIHMIVKETSPYLGIFALIYGVVNNFLNSQDNSDDGSYLPRDNIPIKNSGYGNNDYSGDSSNFPPIDDENSDPESDNNDVPSLPDTGSQIADFYFEDYDYVSSHSGIDDRCSFDCILPTLGLDKRIMHQILEDGFTINGDTIEVQNFYLDIPVQTFTMILYDTANTLFVQKQYGESREYLKKIVEITPHNANLYSNIAVTYFNEHKYNLALDYVDKALDIDPRNNKALGLKSWILAELGYYQDAEIIGSVALELNPTNVDAMMSKSVITSNMNKLETSNYVSTQP